MEKVIDMENMYKEFPNVVALDHVDFSVNEGEVHALIGENGAGKSTLMKILYGIYEKDNGEISIDGKNVDINSAKDAMDLGVGMVHQEFMLSPEMTVLENIILGFETDNNQLFLDYNSAYDKINSLAEEYGFSISLKQKVQNISVGEAQRVEILKSLYRGAKYLILDEPTAVLTPQETEELFKTINFLKENGKTIIFISHKLNEVLEIADRMTVMRDGEKVATLTNQEASKKKLAKLMVGREVFLDFSPEETEKGENVLEVKNLRARGKRELSSLKDISFNVKKGEILGVAGVDGNGQSELVEILTGLKSFKKGKVILNNEEITSLSPLEIRQKGLAHIPEDRNIMGVCKEMTIQENLIANKLFDNPFSKGIIIKFDKVKKYAEDLIEKFDIRPPKTSIEVGDLSGGNMQKVVVAREVSEDADFVVASQPTRGVDIGSMEFIRSILLEERKKGKGVLLVSADLEEIMTLSDRIVVMYEGEIVGEVDRQEATEEKIGYLMTGGVEQRSDSA
jgi:simple sugar transport system ATP-binding protein